MYIYAVHIIFFLAALITVCVLQTRKALYQSFTTKPVTEDSVSCMFHSNPTERIIFPHSEQKDVVHISTAKVCIFV